MQLSRSQVSIQFADLFTKTVGLTDGEFELLLTHFRSANIPRKYFLLSAGQVCTHHAYLNKGSARTFTMDEKGGEHILHFSFEDWWVGDLESLQTKEPSKLYVQAVEDCEFLCILNDDFEKLQNQFPKLKAWHDSKMIRNLYGTLNRLAEVKTFTPEERYLNLLTKYPQIFQRIPLQYIASYLDIEPPSLSRMRKRLSKQ